MVQNDRILLKILGSENDYKTFQLPQNTQSEDLLLAKIFLSWTVDQKHSNLL